MLKSLLNPEYVKAVSRLVNRSPYFELLSMEVKDLRWGTALMEVEIEEKHLQPFRNVHGGVMASVVDAVAFWAVFPQVERGKGLITVEIKVNYLAPVQNGRLVAHGQSIKLGKTLALGEARITNSDGKLVSHGTATMMILPELNLPGDEDLPPVR
jgi:uncharacterized protein (TIGR00369 family)